MLSIEGQDGSVGGFGVAAGAALVAASVSSANGWSRIARNHMDPAMLGRATISRWRTGTIRGAPAFVATITVLSAIGVRGLDGGTGRFVSART